MIQDQAPKYDQSGAQTCRFVWECLRQASYAAVVVVVVPPASSVATSHHALTFANTP